jgi:glycerate kinase
MSDGGDGFGPTLASLLGGRARSLTTTDATGRPRRARWWWVPRRRIAIIEAAQSNGLALLPQGTWHPFDLDTFGVARLIQRALASGARQCLVGVGGSATNDGGFGLARAFGWTFLDRTGGMLLRWTDLDRLSRIVAPPGPPPDCRFVVATDVDNPLLGRRGASRIYGPQKGLRPRDLPKAEACLRRLATIVRRQFGIDSRQPGAGAAGGLGFGLMAFLQAERRPGFDLFAEFAGLERRLRGADLVITGEGAFDRQSLMGKGVGRLLAAAARSQRPVLVLAGRSEAGGRAPRALRGVHSLAEVTSVSRALAEPARWLRLLAARAARAWSAPT